MEQGEREFIERLGSVAEEQGLPRIGARLLGYLMLQEEPRSLDQLAEDLGVSKASISVNARWLEQLGIVERSNTLGDRRDYYRLGEDPWERMFAVVHRRMRRMHDVLEAGQGMLASGDAVGRRRLGEWKRFYAFLLDDLQSKVERWREYRARGAGAEASSSAEGEA